MEVPQSLASLNSELAHCSDELGQKLGRSLASPAYLESIRCAQCIEELAHQIFERCVQQSSEAGHTWQEIGVVLGVTRQAAFQRFGKPIDPRTGQPMDKVVRMAAAPERARSIVSDVLHGRMREARKSFNAQMLAAFTDQARGDALATVAGLVGAFEGFGSAEPFVRRVGDHTVVDIPLHYEAGDMKARVAFDADEKIAGLFILTPDTA